MLHETLPGCINTGVRIISKLDENFLIIKIPLGKKKKKGQEEWKNGAQNVTCCLYLCCSISRYAVTTYIRLNSWAKFWRRKFSDFFFLLFSVKWNTSNVSTESIWHLCREIFCTICVFSHVADAKATGSVTTCKHRRKKKKTKEKHNNPVRYNHF